MKKYLLLILCVFCASCADMTAQMNSLKSSMGGQTTPSSSQNTVAVDSQKKSPSAQSGSISTAANKQLSTAQTGIQKSNETRSSAPDTAAYVNQEVDKAHKQMDPQGNRQKYKDLLSQADSAYRCLYGNSYIFLKDGFIIFNRSREDITGKYFNIRADKALAYFSMKSPYGPGDINYVLDTKELKIVSTFKLPPNQIDPIMEESCKKIK